MVGSEVQKLKTGRAGVLRCVRGRSIPVVVRRGMLGMVRGIQGDVGNETLLRSASDLEDDLVKKEYFQIRSKEKGNRLDSK